MILDVLQKLSLHTGGAYYMRVLALCCVFVSAVQAENTYEASALLDAKPALQGSSVTFHTTAESSRQMAADMPVMRPSAHTPAMKLPADLTPPAMQPEPKINHYPDPFSKKSDNDKFAPWVQLQSDAQPATGAPKMSPFPAKHLEFMVMEIGLRDFLQELTRENGNFSLTLARDVDGLIKNARITGTMEEILQKLAREFNYEWMVDGPELYIASRAKNDFKVVKDKRLTDEQFREALADIYAPNLSYMVKNNRLNTSIDIRGPKDFVKRFEQRFESTEANQLRIIRFGKVYQE